MKKIFISTIFLGLFLIVFSCKKDYIVGGVKQDVNLFKNLTTYDYLKTNPLFDTLVRLIDTAGIKNQINANGNTFFAPPDNTILAYLQARTVFVQNTINQYGKFALDSVFYYLRTNKSGLKDSLLMYIIPKTLPYDSMSSLGKIYRTLLPNDSVIVSYEYTTDPNLGYNSLVSSVPQIVYLTHLWKPYIISNTLNATNIPDSVGTKLLVQTSGINTQNGIVNVLSSGHTLFYYGTKK